ncbi:MAG TPA: thymidine phosphorylase family protein [Gemmatimonadales bacterium]|nr:thymidine phosphorylase family protein [Gemmatimonadales bacterium]
MTITSPAAGAPPGRPSAGHRARRLGIDTGREAVVYLHRDSPVVHSEGFDSATRITVRCHGRRILATLSVVTGPLLAPDDAGLSEAAWSRLGVAEGQPVELAHSLPLDSLRYVRAKTFGARLEAAALSAVVTDIAGALYSDIHIASFITACAGDRLDLREIKDLTVAMLGAGERLRWQYAPVMDKHCVGGLPGNRTSLVIVPIVAAAGLVMPKTSSRAITSPAGTADAMETLAPVDLDREAMRRVVEREGGCIVWGGKARLSPADDVLIRVERALDLDSVGQLVASVLSKKAAAGATHVVVDVPVGLTAKIRSPAEADRLTSHLRDVGRVVDLEVLPLVTDGSQPVGRGLGPALEARDALAVLRGEPGAPADLRERALFLAGYLLELGGATPAGNGQSIARAILAEGAAWRKFQAICEAQGGMREPPRARFTRPVLAPRAGQVCAIDNRRLARVAKLAGAPRDAGAGLELHTRVAQQVTAGEPLFTVHAAAPGELEYALAYAAQAGEIIQLAETP